MIAFDGFGVVNSLGHLVPCMDGGKTRHHVAIWATEPEAERFARTMRGMNRARADTYEVRAVRVEVRP